MSKYIVSENKNKCGINRARQFIISERDSNGVCRKVATFSSRQMAYQFVKEFAGTGLIISKIGMM